MNFVFPRVIKANRGDIASRWLLLRSVHNMDVGNYAVFGYQQDDFPPEVKKVIPYGKVRNVFPTLEGWRVLKSADAVLWSVGLDLQDDSSLLKLIYLYVMFKSYRWLGLKIYVLFQGAGPLETKTGRFFAKKVLQQVELFIARDPKTFALVKEIYPKLRASLGHDAIFLPDVDVDLNNVAPAELEWITELISDEEATIAFNLRQWFHFSSSLLPYMFLRQKYQARSEKEMAKLIDGAVETIKYLREKYKARILLLSAYQPDIEPWEDDLQWLQLVKKSFGGDPDVVLVEKRISMAGYYKLLSKLKLVIGMRLHTTLISLRLGIPSINLSYTIKGGSILRHLELDDFVINLETFLNEPENLFDKVDYILANEKKVCREVSVKVNRAVEANREILAEFFRNEAESL
jgi:polysaccharide pyruvyl transferase WcaK-like protein